jgi:hypothetical protein
MSTRALAVMGETHARAALGVTSHRFSYGQVAVSLVLLSVIAGCATTQSNRAAAPIDVMETGCDGVDYLQISNQDDHAVKILGKGDASSTEEVCGTAGVGRTRISFNGTKWQGTPAIFFPRVAVQQLTTVHIHRGCDPRKA